MKMWWHNPTKKDIKEQAEVFKSYLNDLEVDKKGIEMLENINSEIKENIIGIVKNCLLFEEHVEKEIESGTATVGELINLRVIREIRQFFTKLILPEEKANSWCKGKHSLTIEGYFEEIIGKLNAEIPLEILDKYNAVKNVRKTYLE